MSALVLPRDQWVLTPLLTTLFGIGLVGWRGLSTGFNDGRTPALLVIVAFAVVPGILSVLLSLFDVTSANLLAGGWRFVGLQGFRDILADPDEQAVFLRTLLFAAACVALQFAIGVPWGYLIASKPRMDWADGLLVLPVVMPPIITAMLWRAAFDGSYGVIARLFRLAGREAPAWFSLHSAASGPIRLLPGAMGPSIAAEAWQWTPFVAIVTALSLRQAAPDLVRWSRALASHRWRAIWVTEFPLVSRLLLLLAVLRILDSLKTFESVWVPFGNGILTATISIRIVTYALEQRDYAVASALSAVMLLMVIVLTAFATPHVLEIRRGRRG